MYDFDEKPELNITPLVDVMLVLLAILMVITPNIVYEEMIKLPKGSGQTALSKISPVHVTINVKGEVFVNKKKFQYRSFGDNFYTFAQTLNKKASVLISADRRLDYGKVMNILGAVKNAGFTEVSLATNG